MNDCRDSHGRRAHAYNGSYFRENRDAKQDYAAFLTKQGIELTGQESFPELQQKMIEWAREDDKRSGGVI